MRLVILLAVAGVIIYFAARSVHHFWTLGGPALILPFA